MIAMASLGWAGDYHYGINLVCQDCHVMHYSQSHGYNPNGSGNFTQLGAGGPYEYLLRNDINDLCRSCHDGQAFAPDVVEAHGNAYVRQGGALNEVGGNGQYPPPTGHTLGETDPAPGGTWTNVDGLNCADCHSVHGRSSLPAPGSFRNLRGPGSIDVAYSRGDVEGSNDLTKWVFEDVSSGVTTNHYGFTHVVFNEPDVAKSKYGEFCKGCHTNFHGDVGGTEIGGTGTPAEEFVRHPANGTNIGGVGGGHSSLSRFAGKVNQVPVMSPTGQRPGGYNGTDTGVSPSCMSCHKGHGNQNAFGLMYMLGTGTITEQGDAGVDARNTCRQCHVQGGTGSW
jgi:hypothetical protein